MTKLVGINSHAFTVVRITMVPVKLRNITITSNMVKGSFLSMMPMSLENLETETLLFNIGIQFSCES